MPTGNTTTNVTYTTTTDTVRATNRAGQTLIEWPAAQTTYIQWDNSYTTLIDPKIYEISFTSDSYIMLPQDLLDEIKRSGVSVNKVKDLFVEFCHRLIDLDEDIRLDEALHDSEDLDDFLKEFIVNNKKN